MELSRLIFNLPESGDFETLALDVFHYQFANNSIYREYASSLQKTTPRTLDEIPFLPIEFFKSHKVYCGNEKPELTFKSSGTTGMIRSQHFVQSAAIYKHSFLHTYQKMIGLPNEQVILALLPNYIEQGESSLVFMVDHLIKASQNPMSGFLLNTPELILERYQKAIERNKKVILFGVSYALLDLAEKGIDLSKALIIETGGMKGRRKEMTKSELHEAICQGTGVSFVSSEYGMTELLSQAYSDKNGFFTCPAWMKVLIRDINDPFSFVPDDKSGGINVIDLANLHSCSFIATQDLGKKTEDHFEVLGRFDHSDLRGCNLMVE
jgi:phenylacetate-coenzyme A ligase PaaK-like adenylate-forming protein